MNNHHRKRHMDWSNSWFQLVVGAVLGGVIALYFARVAARDTQRQLELAQQQLTIAVQQTQVSELQSRMMRTLLVTAEEQGLVKLARDAKGEITGGRVIELRGAVQESPDVVHGVGHVGEAPATK
jgi:hypothetical protein